MFWFLFCFGSLTFMKHDVGISFSQWEIYARRGFCGICSQRFDTKLVCCRGLGDFDCIHSSCSVENYFLISPCQPSILAQINFYSPSVCCNSSRHHTCGSFCFVSSGGNVYCLNLNVFMLSSGCFFLYCSVCFIKIILTTLTFLSFFFSMSLSICLPAYLSVYPSVGLTAWMPVCLFDCLSIWLSACLRAGFLSTWLSFYLYMENEERCTWKG